MRSRLLPPTWLFGGLLLATVGSSAFAAVTNWSMNFDTSPCNSITSSSMGNFDVCNSTAAGSNPTPSAGVGAFSTTGSGTSFANANLAWNGASYGFGVRNATGGVNTSGVATNGMEDSNGGQHAMDNSGATDLIGFAFSEAVAITSVTLGWVQTDSDFSLLRWVPDVAGDAPDVNSQLLGKTVASLTTQSPATGTWQLVGNYNNTNTGTTDTTIAPINSGGLTSSWWLISAYNSGYGGASNGATNGNDYMKVLAIAGSAGTPPPQAPGLPEPGSLALVGVALFGAVAAVRRRPVVGAKLVAC